MEDRIGGGGIGQVFRGWDLEAEQQVAIKVLRHFSPTDIKRFAREAKLLADAKIAGVVRHIHHNITDENPFLVMEWLAGDTVARRMEDRGFDVAESVALVTTVCDPLGELHARGLVHRDLKPENLVMTGPAATDVVLIDLGLARSAARADQTRLTATGCVLGTPAYMAPEQVRGDAIDVRVDVFALGCLLYECLTGYAAFAGENFFAVRTKILVTTPPQIDVLCPEAPRGLQDLVYRMIAKNPEDRPQTREVKAALAALGTMPASPRRLWSTERPPTLKPDAVLRPPTAMPATVTQWTGVVMVRAGTAGDSDERRDELDQTLASHADRILAAVPEARVERLEGGYLVVVLPPSEQLAPLARLLATAALTLRSLVESGSFAISAGMTSIDELVDRSALLLETLVRSTLVDETEAAPIVVDPITAAELSAEFELVKRPEGDRLVGRRVR